MTAWTRDLPTKPGWYWWRDIAPHWRTICQVIETGKGLEAWFINTDYGTPPQELSGSEWQGPLEPKE